MLLQPAFSQVWIVVWATSHSAHALCGNKAFGEGKRTSSLDCEDRAQERSSPCRVVIRACTRGQWPGFRHVSVMNVDIRASIEGKLCKTPLDKDQCSELCLLSCSPKRAFLPTLSCPLLHLCCVAKWLLYSSVFQQKRWQVPFLYS